MANKHEKDAPHHNHQENAKLLDFRLKYKTLTAPNAEEHVEHQKHLFITGQNTKCYSYMDRQVGSFYKAELNISLP